MLSDEQKRNLSAIAKGRSRDSKGRLLPATSAHEAKIAELEAENARLITQLELADDQIMAFVEAAQEQDVIRRAQFAVAGLIVSLISGAAMYFVGRWAR